MRLSAKSRFAVAAMIDLALREAAGPVPLNSIGQRLQISLSYLEQLFSKLRRANLVESTRGPGGGYTLGRSAQRISVADIIRAVEGAQELMGEESSDAGEAGLQLTRDLWSGLNSRMMDHMEGIKLHQLCEEQRAKGVDLGNEATPAAQANSARNTTQARRGIFATRPVERPRTTAPNSVFALGAALAAASKT
jgi:Rrf2 family iron-sulfur cluster assembly transcriptional regulator